MTTIEFKERWSKGKAISYYFGFEAGPGEVMVMFDFKPTQVLCMSPTNWPSLREGNWQSGRQSRAFRLILLRYARRFAISRALWIEASAEARRKSFINDWYWCWREGGRIFYRVRCSCKLSMMINSTQFFFLTNLRHETLGGTLTSGSIRVRGQGRVW